MSSAITDLEIQIDLRKRAESRVSAGPHRVGGLPSASAALGVLLQLASSPSTAADALALLHELQVYQVEIELQGEELRSARDELEVALARQLALYDHAPVGYLTLDAGLAVHELNLTAARMVGCGRAEVIGGPLSRFLQPRSAADLQALLARVRGGRLDERCSLLLQARDRSQRVVHATASIDTVDSRYLVVLVDLGAAAGAAL